MASFLRTTNTVLCSVYFESEIIAVLRETHSISTEFIQFLFKYSNLLIAYQYLLVVLHLEYDSPDLTASGIFS